MTAIEVADDLTQLDAAMEALPNQPAVFVLWPKEGEPYLSKTGLLRRRLLRPDHRLGLIVRPRGGGEQQRAIGDRLLHGVEQLDLVQDMIGARGGALRAARSVALAKSSDRT